MLQAGQWGMAPEEVQEKEDTIGYLNLSLSLWLQPPKSSKILQIMISARGRFFSPNAFQAKILFQAGIIARMNS